jgi:Acetyltransferase (GNAT) domain
MTLEIFSAPDELPESAASLFVAAANRGFDSSWTWYQTVIEHGLPAGVVPCFALSRQAQHSAVLFPLQVEQRGRSLKSMTNAYTWLYRPLVHPEAEHDALRQAGRELGRFCRDWSAVRIDALDPASAELPPLLAGLRDAGLLSHRFAHFGNWHHRVAGAAWADYLASRPGQLRETVRRRLRKAERNPELRFDLIETADAADAGIAAYEEVYLRSWKEPEPLPRFNPELMRRAASLGVLRLGLLTAKDRPIAAQYWVVSHGQASLLKLAHDEAFKSLSPGTVLTAMMIRLLLDRDHVDELDFGRGDDPYKQLWAAERRQRIGVVLMNPRRPTGLITLGRHLLGHGVKVPRKLLGRGGAGQGASHSALR